jgi:pimeloyl-ACP methyl ester carboxylesterase
MRAKNVTLIVIGMMIVTTVIFVHTRLDQLYPMALTWELFSHAVLDIVNGQEMETKKIRVGDIDIAYRMFGNSNGKPILLINGFSAPLDFWDPILLANLASNHTVIVFDNRGIGNTTSGIQKFSISQFANDTAGLLDALNVSKVDVIGWSMGGMIAQELTLMHPDKVDKLVVHASSCGGKESVLPSQEVIMAAVTISNNPVDRIQKILPLLFPEVWRMQNPNYLETLPKTTEVIPSETLDLQTEAILNWEGVCDKLNIITQPTLVVVGTDDVFTPSSNSLLIAEKINGSRLVQIPAGGHGVMFQYPETFNSILQTFLLS